MNIEEVNKIATHSESKWRVIDRTNEIIEIEVTYRKRSITLLAEVEDSWCYSSHDPEDCSKDRIECVKEIYAVKDEEGELMVTQEGDLKIIDRHFHGLNVNS